MNGAAPPSHLTISRLGHRGEGVARVGKKTIFVPYALAGETVEAEIDGDQARLTRIIDPSPDRVPPICRYFARCGGCAVQTLREDRYLDWKRDLVSRALHNAGLQFEPEGVIDAHGEGRRRVTFHARMEDGHARVGFMAARSHEVVEIDACPLLAPALGGALPAARDIARALAPKGKPLDIAITATLDGMDVELRGAGPLKPEESSALIALAERHDLARMTNHGALVALRRPPDIEIGAARVTLPPGAFLQATAAGESALAALVQDATQGAGRVADLFCGVGAFALLLARTARVSAYDNNLGAVESLLAAARTTQSLREIECETRDLFQRPLLPEELIRFDAVVFDPPRAGALAQARAISGSNVETVIAVSCNAQSFARDANILIAGGYALRRITPIDQFRFSAHVEIVAHFVRRDPRRAKNRRLLR